MGSTEWASAAVLACFFSRHIVNMAFSSLTLFSAFPSVTRHHEYILAQSIGIISSTSWTGRETDRMFVSPRLCAVQNAGQRLIVSKFNLRIKPKIRPQGTKASKCLNVGKLRLPSTSQYSECLNTFMEAAWNTLCNTVYNTAFECLRLSTKDWFDKNCAEITQLLQDKHRAYNVHIDDPTFTAKTYAL